MEETSALENNWYVYILIFLFNARIGTSYPDKTPIIRCSSKRTPTINKK